VRYSQREYREQHLTEKIIAAGVAVHRELGPGFVEKIYENAQADELEDRGHRVDRQVVVEVSYRGRTVGEHRIDLLVDDTVVLELKSVEALVEVHKAQLRSTLKAAGKRVGLLVNFNGPRLTEGVRRVIN
jgi:GxxExxY protein